MGAGPAVLAVTLAPLPVTAYPTGEPLPPVKTSATV